MTNATRTYRTEFPDFPADSAPIAQLLARGFIDTSSRKEASPSFESMGVRIWVDLCPPEERDGNLHFSFGVAYANDAYGEQVGNTFNEEFEDFADAVALFDAYASEFNALPEWARKPITSRVEAEDFIRSAHDAGKLWHLDDSPTSVEPAFSRAEIGAFLMRCNECFEHTDNDPHAYCVFLSRPASWRALDDAMRAKYGEGLGVEQRECIDDSARREECLDMLDDMIARLDMPAEVVQAVIAELDGDWQ